jgi:predicted outer membrane repeat protein
MLRVKRIAIINLGLLFCIFALSNVAKGQNYTISDFTKIVGFSWRPDGQVLSIAGIINGQTSYWLFNAEFNYIDNIPTQWAVGYHVWSPDGTKIIGKTANPQANNQYYQIFDVATKQVIGEFERGSGDDTIDWGADSTTVGIPTGSGIEIYSTAGEILKEIAIGNQVVFVNGVYQSQRAYILAGADSQIQVWNANNGNLISTWNVNTAGNTISISPNGQRIAVSTYDYNILIYDAINGQLLYILNIPNSELVFRIIWNNDNLHLATYDTSGAILIWNTETQEITDSAFLTDRRYSLSIAWRPNTYQLTYPGENILPIIETMSLGNSFFTPTATFTSTPIPPTATNTPTPTETPTNTPTPTETPTNTPTPTETPTYTLTPTETPTNTSTPTETPTNTSTPTNTPTETPTPIACTHTVVASSVSSLISAIVSSNSASTPSTICLGGGVYSLTAVNNSTDGANGLPSITKNITIIGNNSVIERATSAPQFRIFHVGASGRLALNNLTVRGGNAGSLSGGGIRNLGILELNTVIVENNTGNAGGGIRNNNNATMIATNSLIRNNISTTNGGGLYANNSSSTTLTNTNFLGNTVNVSNGLGGAIFSNGNIFTMNGGIIQNNSARNGAGIFVNITTQAMSLNGVQFTGNTASNHGAGIYHLSSTNFSLQNGRFTSNTATNEGGAIAGDGTFTITNSNFVSNSANIGGAIHAQATSGSSIQQSCLENNTAPNTIGIFNEVTIVLNAQNNFWGSAGASSSVSANVNTNGALIACPNP